MMRWEHLNRTRPFYLSSAEWAAHCSLFDGADWRGKCEEIRFIKSLEVQIAQPQPTKKSVSWDDIEF